MKKSRFFSVLPVLLSLLAVCFVVQPSRALGQKDLQRLLDGTDPSAQHRASDEGFIEIDLSAFTEPITETLYVRNQNIRFVNGVLKQKLYQDFTLIQIQNGYQLELAASASLEGTNYPSTKPFVDIQHGKFIINGGHITGIYNIIRPVNFGNGQVFSTSPRNISVELTGGALSEFSMSSGEVYGSIKDNAGGKIKIGGGIIDHIQTSTFFYMSGKVNILENVLLSNEMAYVGLMSPLQTILHIAGYVKNQMILMGQSDDIPTYIVSEQDVKKIVLDDNVNDYRLELDKTCGAVYVREASIDYGNITNEDDLQKALDEIAEKNPSTPVDLTIAPEGIDLTKSIRADANCRARISGGPIRIVGNGNSYFTDDALFFIQEKASLAFHDIMIDFRQARLNAEAFSVASGGSLTIYQNVVYQNVIENIISSWGEFYYNGGSLQIESGILPHISGRVLTNGRSYDSNSSWVYVNGDLFDRPVVYNKAGSRIVFDAHVSSQWTFEGDWANYELEKAFITKHGDDLAASDYWQMKFVDLPSTTYHRTVYYDGKSHSIKLKTYNSLQDLLDGDDDGKVDIPCDGVDVGADLTLEERLQWELDGSKCPAAQFDPVPIWMPGGCAFIEIHMIARYITFDSFSSGHRLYIRNKTEFKDKVVARNFLVFSIIEKGGHLIWENAETENVLYPIYNTGGRVDILGGALEGTIYNAGILTLSGGVKLSEIQAHPQGVIQVTSKILNRWMIDLTFDEANSYPDGFVIMEGAEGYKLTFDDLDQLELKIPDGCKIVLDTNRNVIVLKTTINQYKLTYEVDGLEYSSYTLNYGDRITAEDEPTKEGYTFSGWSEIPETMPEEDVTITGTFTVNKYTITYVIDGEVYTTETVDYGTAITPPATPTKDGYEFAWSDYPSTMPAGDITITGSYITGIDVITLSEGDTKIFSLDGKFQKVLRKGVNIVLMNDGKRKKVIVK